MSERGFVKGFDEITLAMDLSITSPGFAVLAIHEGKPIILETHVLKTDGKKSHGERLRQIADEIDLLVKEYKPEHIVREKGFSRFPQVTQTLFKVVGVSDLRVYDGIKKEVEEIPVTTVKKAVTGDGKATKEEVADKIFKVFRIENTDEFYTKSGKLIDDKTDAIAVGYALLLRKKLI